MGPATRLRRTDDRAIFVSFLIAIFALLVLPPLDLPVHGRRDDHRRRNDPLDFGAFYEFAVRKIEL